jgi:hypothetical protein
MLKEVLRSTPRSYGPNSVEYGGLMFMGKNTNVAVIISEGNICLEDLRKTVSQNIQNFNWDSSQYLPNN